MGGAASRAYCRLSGGGDTGILDALGAGDRRHRGCGLPPGSYWTQAADQPHKDACVSDEACIILLINQEPYETYLSD